MRAYLPISHGDLVGFLSSQGLEKDRVFASTPDFLDENADCDAEEIEYLLSVLAGASSLELRSSSSAPGLVLALELIPSQCGENIGNSITLNAPIMWGQVQCALLAYGGSDELVWFATQEIAQEIDSWR